MFDCWLSWEEKENKRIHYEIEKHLKKERRESRRCYKLLLLGAGESGKSTFVKQMRIIHGKGFTKEDLKAYTQFVHCNIVQSMHSLVEAMPHLGIQYNGNGRHLDRMMSCNPNSNIAITPEQFRSIGKLWRDRAIQEAYSRRNEFQLSDSTSYFMSRLDIIASSNYLPSTDDILHVRVPTTGIVEHKFMVNSVEFQVIDVGGQRSERRKWLHLFDNVTSVIFLASLAEYDQTLFEDHSVNRMEESLSLYRAIVSNPWFENASIILFLNKKDILQEKIKYSHLVDYFPEYTGPKRNEEKAQNYILSMFAEVFVEEKKEDSKSMYPHFTSATDTKNMMVVFNAVKATILEDQINTITLM